MMWFELVWQAVYKIRCCVKLRLSLYTLDVYLYKQKESSLEVKSSDWLHMESSCVDMSSVCYWCALGISELKSTCFLKHKLVKCPYL